MKGLSLVSPTSPRRGLSCHFDSANEKDFALETQCTLMDKLPSHYNTIRFQHLDTVLMLNCGQANHMTKSVSKCPTVSFWENHANPFKIFFSRPTGGQNATKFLLQH